MFDDINSESIRRLTEAKSLLQIIKSETAIKNANIPFDIKIYKGTFFVLLYGALEYTIVESVQRCILQLNSMNRNINEFKVPILSLILHDECNAIMEAKDKKWTKRYDLFSRLNDTSKINDINETLFPTSNGNIKYAQLKSIWDIFGISSPVVSQDKIKGSLSGLADNRNAIAHGRELVSTIGSRYSIEDLEKIYNDISEYCSYITLTFEDYIRNNDFLK